MLPPSSSATGPAGVSWERATIEKLVLANMKEQRATRRWKVFLRLLMVALLAGYLWVLYLGVSGKGLAGKADDAVAGPHTAVVDIKGAIAADKEANADDINKAMRRALKEDNVQALVLRIDSPGGSPVQAGMVYDEVRRLRAEHKKPIYAVIEDTGASAAYYIASAADQVYADKASIVGSIGVLMNGFGFTGLMDKVGVERRLITAGENKGFLDPFSPQTPEDMAKAKAMLAQIHQQFIRVVRQGRGDRLKETPETFSGLFWTGEQAKTLGLVDELKDLRAVARDVVKAEKLVDYSTQPNPIDRLAKRFGMAVGAGAVQAVQQTGGVDLR
nr:S49 family peptidase [Comamonas serinivorans]